MRVIGRDIEIAGRKVAFSYDGEALRGIEGESIAAALTASGRLALRHIPGGGRSGLFCGMGACQECVVTADGVSGKLACMTSLCENMVVESKPPGKNRATRATKSPGTTPRYQEARPDLLVVGAGPAGLNAALVAAETGLDVMVVDERSSIGGQYYKQLSGSLRFRHKSRMDRQFRDGRRLIERLQGLSVTILRSALLWGAFAPDEFGVAMNGISYLLRPKRIILATGAFERGVPMPGWTLPGAMTTGAAQTLLRAYRVAPGRRVVVAGNGPLNLRVAAELSRAGVDVVSLAEAAKGPGIERVGAAVRAFGASPDLVAVGLRDLAYLRRRGVRVKHRHVVVRIEGREKVEAAVLARIDEAGSILPGTESRVPADAVCMGYGFLPQNELARSLGCRHRRDPRFDQLAVERDADGRTSIDRVFVAGDAGGLGGARIAACQGAIAAFAAARDLGRRLTTDHEAQRRALARDLARHQRFQKALWELYRAPVLIQQLAGDDTDVCRCEGVSKAALEAAIGDGATTLDRLKRRTRAGMGPCQGRYCGAVMARLIADHDGRPVDYDAYFAPRSPAKPVAIAAIAEPVKT